MTLHNKFSDLRILVMEEDVSFSKLLHMLLNDIGVTQIQTMNTNQHSFSVFSTSKADALFIDADMAFMQRKGVEIGHWLRQQGVFLPLVFMTSHLKQYDAELFIQLQPVSFMSKELSLVKLLQTLELVSLQQQNASLQQRLNEQSISHTQPAFALPPSGVHEPLEPTNQIFFKVGDSYKAISVPEIAYFYADQKMSYAKIGARSYPTSVQLKVLEEELHPWGFIRAHKSYILNIKHIESFHLGDASVCINGETLPIGYAYRKTFVTSLKLLK